jgi:DNA (cytosine-5)-methyltransferase 1
MTHGSLFSGIGGFDLAAQWMGWDNIFHCEWNPFGQKVLKHHFPKSISYNDITKTDFTIHRGAIDILTGGFPCQPYSLAGKRKGKEDERHLWPEMLRTIREIQPRFVVGENVFGLINWGGGLVFHEVQTDLETAGYEVWPYVLPACAVNAPHRRDRVWFVAHRNDTKNTTPRSGIKWEQPFTEYNRFSDKGNATNPTGIGFREHSEGERLQSKASRTQFRMDKENAFHSNCNGLNGSNGEYEVNASKGRINALDDIEQMGKLNATNTNGIGLERERGAVRELEGGFRFGSTSTRNMRGNSWQNFPTQSPICGGDDGISTELDGIAFSKWRNESIKAFGNAIVPQVAYQIFKAIEQL